MSHIHSSKKEKSKDREKEKEKKRKHSRERHKGKPTLINPELNKTNRLESKPKESNFSKEEENGSSKYPPSVLELIFL